MFALAAALYGAAFAVGVLVPLWLMFRRRTSRLWWNLAVPAVALWVTLAVGFYAVVPADLSPAEVLGNALTVVPAGVAEVVAFVFLIRSQPRPPT